MEGGREGMVAVIQGLENAGLAVTVVKARYQGPLYNHDKICAGIMAPSEKCLPPVKCSVEPSTQAHQPTLTAQQTHADQYTSTYQMAHCSIRPVSPTANMSQLPMRSPGINRSIQGPVSSQVNEAFVESLRKYPLTPHHASDFIGGLLACTEHKNAFIKSRSPHSPKHKTRNSSGDNNTKSENIQTYKREKYNKEAVTVTNHYRQSTKKTRTPSPVDYKDIKYKDNQLNATYNYLQSTSPARRTRDVEVRYLQEVSRCVKNTLRKIMDGGTVTCPQVQSRYSQHIRDHHRRGSELHPSCISTCPNHPNICRSCEKPLPCICNTPVSSPHSLHRQVEDTAGLEKIRSNQLWTEEIFNWLQGVPVNANITLKDKARRRNMAEELVNALIAMKNDKDFEPKANEIVKKILSSLPIWTPTTKSEQENFIKQICDNLMSRLKLLIQGEAMVEKDNIITTNIPVQTIEENIKGNVNNTPELAASKLDSIDLQDKFEKEFLDWLNDIPELSEGTVAHIGENKKDIRNLAKKLQEQEYEKIDDRTIQEQMYYEIKDWLESMMKQNSGLMNLKRQQKLAEKLLEKLVNAVKYSNKATKSIFPNEDDQIKDKFERIWSCIQNIPELSHGSKSENQEIMKFLATKLHTLNSESIKDGGKVQNEILNWLANEAEKKTPQWNMKTRAQLSSNLAEGIRQIPTRYQTSFSFEDSAKENCLEQIYCWFKDLPELVKGSESEYQNMVQSLATLLQNVSFEGKENDDEIQNLVANWLANETETKGIKMSRKSQDQLANKLLGAIKNTASKHKSGLVNSINENYLEQIGNVLADIPELEENKSEFEKIIKSLTTKLQNLLSEGGKEEDEIGNEISNWLVVESKKKGIKLSPGSEAQLANKLIPKLKKIIVPTLAGSLNNNTTIRKPRKHWDHVKMSNEKTDKSLINIIGETMPSPSDPVDILPKDIKSKNEKIYNVRDKNRVENCNKIESKLINEQRIHDQVTYSDDENTMTKHIFSDLQEGDLHYNDEKNLNSTVLSESITISSDNPSQRQVFRDSTERTILQFIEEIIGNQSSPMRNKIRKETAKLAEKLTDILADSELIIKEKEYIIFHEISEFLTRLSLPQKDFVSKIIERIQNVSYKTSTPDKCTSDSDFSRYLKTNDMSIPATKIDENLLAPSKQEVKFIEDLITVIHKWTLELPVDWNKNKSLMNSMLTELAKEIAERQKYLHMHSNSKPSEQEELEHLKYHVFRCLNKEVDDDNLLLIMSKVESLINGLRKISMPQQSTSKSLESNFIQTITSNLSDTLYKDKQEIHKEYNTYENNQKGKLWPSNGLEKSRNIKTKPKTESLRAPLKEKRNRDESSTTGLPHGSSQSNIKKLKEAVLDFVRTLPLHKKNNYEELILHEQLSAQLANSLQKLLKSDIEKHNMNFDELIIDKSRNYLKKFPINPVVREDDSFFTNISQQLLKHLKRLQLLGDMSERNLGSVEKHLIANDEDKFSLPKNTETFTKDLHSSNLKDDIKKVLRAFSTDISKNPDFLYIEEKVEQLSKKMQALLPSDINPNLVTDAILNWSKSIPLQTGKTTTDILSALNSFSERIFSILSTAVEHNNKNKLEEETMKLLKQLPLQSDKMDDIYLQNLGELLINKIKELQTRAIVNSKPGAKAADIVYSIIENWCNGLPVASGSAPEELERVKTMKQILASKLANKIAELNMNPEIFDNDILYEKLLQDELDNIFLTLPPSPELGSNLVVIKDNLIKEIRQAKLEIKDTLSGQGHEKHLLEVTPSTTPLDISPSMEEVSLEDLKYSLADAYINFIYGALNNEQKNKLRKKIADEIEKFSNYYLRHSGTPQDTKKLKEYLYSALKYVPVSNGEILRTVSTTEKEQNNVAVLAKHLYELGKEIELRPELDINDEVKKEILKWLNSFPLTPSEGNVDQVTEKLTSNLKNAEQPRKGNTSKNRKSVENDEPEFSHTHRLTMNDKAHMEKIRQRNIPSTLGNLLPHDYHPPLSIDVASQTEVKTVYPEKGPEISSHTKREVDTKLESSPKIIIKEYFWGASNPNLNEFIYRIPCMSKQPCNINPCGTPSSIKISCPKSTYISAYDYEAPPQISLRPIDHNTQMPSMAQREMSHPPSNNQLLHPLQRSCPHPPCPGSLNRMRTNCTANQQCPRFKTGRHVTTQKQSTVESFNRPLATPDIPSSPSRMPRSTPYMPTSIKSPSPANVSNSCTAPRIIPMKGVNIPFRQHKESEDTPVTSDNPEVGSSKCLLEHVIKLGSLDDVPCPKLCRRPQGNISIGVLKENCKQSTVRSPSKKIWDTPCYRPRIYRIPYDNCNGNNNSETSEQTIRCKRRCTTRMKPRSHHSDCQSCESLRRCSKCCGMSCPHPSGFYFC